MIIGPMTMAQLASRITPAAGRTVLDRTGLGATRYFFAVTYSPLSAQPAESAPESGALDIFRALEQQLGLKLEPAREPLEILIVDHAVSHRGEDSGTQERGRRRCRMSSGHPTGGIA